MIGIPNGRTFINILTQGLLVLSWSGFLSGQISPGKLSKGHSHLEGISNCTQCHELGSKISEQKCLNCHSQLKSRINERKGFHATEEVRSKSCISCHSEHHGIKFEIIRFDKQNFDHGKTGYKLTGAHARVDCRTCHKPEHIRDEELKKKPNTFLGLQTNCLSCHADGHRNTLPNDCQKCHGFESWKPASLFDHSKARFPLAGAHQKVDCKSCHPVETDGKGNFQKFKGIDFKSCVSCHEDAHKGQYGNSCKSCHVETSFKKIVPGPGFNHSLTGYALEGSHRNLDCRKCHDNRPGTTRPLREFASLDKVSCVHCHRDPHESRFGLDCASCHNQNSFKNLKANQEFNHALTRFPLEGKHLGLECQKCHKTGRMTDPVSFAKCVDCHTDFHKGEFFSTGAYRDCADCHNTSGFGLSDFDFERHSKTRFPLKGAHIATPCISCHKVDGQWKFRFSGSDCIHCHQNIHLGAIRPEIYPDQKCTACHQEEAWSDIRFDHKDSGFELKGRHLKISCKSCHWKEGNKQIFKGLTHSCFGCHQDIHQGQFDQNGEKPDCARCHGFEAWDRKNFDHEKSRFSLSGAHQSVSCGQCHETVQRQGKSYVLYRNGKLECRDCHR
jgi:hypothetical protein